MRTIAIRIVVVLSLSTSCLSEQETRFVPRDPLNGGGYPPSYYVASRRRYHTTNQVQCGSYWLLEFLNKNGQMFHWMYAHVPSHMTPGQYASNYAKENNFKYWRVNARRTIYNPRKDRYELPELNRDARNIGNSQYGEF